MRYFCDGSGYNGKHSGYAVVNEGEVLIRVYDEKERTNNEAEYEAVIYALRNATEGDEIYTDSRLVVEQGNGRWKIKEKRLLPYVMCVNALLREKKCRLLWVNREENIAGKQFE